MLPSIFNEEDECERRTDPPRPVGKPPETSRPGGPAREDECGRRTDPTRPLVRPPETSRPSGAARPKSSSKTYSQRSADHSGDGDELFQEPSSPFTGVTPVAPQNLPNFTDMKKAMARVKRAQAGHYTVDSMTPPAGGSIDLGVEQVDLLVRHPYVAREVQEVMEALKDQTVHMVDIGDGGGPPHVVAFDSRGCPPRVEDPLQCSRRAQAFFILLQKTSLKRACSFLQSMRQTHISFPPVVALVLRDRAEAVELESIQPMTETLLKAGAEAVIMQPCQKEDLPQLLACSLGSVRAQRDLKKSATEERASQLFFQEIHSLIEGFPKMNLKIEEIEASKSRPGAVGRHTFLKMLGCGKYGKVYLFQDNSKLEVAKVIPKANIRYAKHAKQILKECLLLREVSRHPNIVGFTGFTHARRNLYIFMDFGGEFDLVNVMSKSPGGRLDSATTQGLIIQVADAVSYCHSKNVAHRDLKPENVVLDSSGSAVLVDFGLAVNADKLCEDKCGTVPFSPPEVYRGLAFEPKSMDVWGLGVLLLHILCGNHSLLKMMNYSQTPEPGNSLADALQKFFSPDDLLPWPMKIKNWNSSLDIPPDFLMAMMSAILIDPRGRCSACVFYEQLAGRSWTDRANDSANELEALKTCRRDPAEAPMTSRRAPAALPPVDLCAEWQSDKSRLINEGVDSARPTFR